MEHEVEQVLDERARYSKRQHLVRWKGFDSSFDSWEPLENLRNVQRALSRFRASHRQKNMPTVFTGRGNVRRQPVKSNRATLRP
jgi:hypothetical protein